MSNDYNVLDDNEMNELITIQECRKLREVIHILTVAPMITKREYISLFVVIDRILKRMEKEGESDAGSI